MLHDYIRVNISMLAAIAVAFPVSAAAADVLSDAEPHLNATYTTIADYAAYLGTFGIMFYATNRHRYRQAAIDDRAPRLRSDLKKIIASLGIAEIVYGVARWVMQYYLLDMWQYEPYVASVAAQTVAVAIYVMVMNLSIKATRMYQSDNDDHKKD